MNKKVKSVVLVLFLMVGISMSYGQSQGSVIPPFDKEIASKFVSLASQCISAEYPNKISHSMQSDHDIKSPRALHPAFYGCYDWHSSVHGHWLLVKCLNMFPDLPNRDKVVEAIGKNLSAENISKEVAYIKAEGRSSFERPYGWAWLLKLQSELYVSNQPYAKQLYTNLKPLSDQIKKMYYDYLPGLYYPIRRGVHENTAFGIAMALDYARAVNDKTFESFLVERAKFYYGNDKNYPSAWEPEGDDFFSPSLIEADLMRRVFSRDDFLIWFKNFMPQFSFSLQHPVVVANRKDPKGIHLDGLNLSRAWCMFELAKAIPDDSQLHTELWQAGYRHASEALPNVVSDNYYGTHWLATFAVYMYMSLQDVMQY